MLLRAALLVVASALCADGFMPPMRVAAPANALLGLRRGVVATPPTFKATPAPLRVASPIQSSGTRGGFMQKKKEQDRKEKAAFVQDLSISPEQKEEYLQSVAVYGIHWVAGDDNLCRVSCDRPDVLLCSHSLLFCYTVRLESAAVMPFLLFGLRTRQRGSYD